MPFAPAFSRLCIAQVDDDCPIARSAFAYVTFHRLSPTLHALNLRLYPTSPSPAVRSGAGWLKASCLRIRVRLDPPIQRSRFYAVVSPAPPGDEDTRQGPTNSFGVR